MNGLEKFEWFTCPDCKVAIDAKDSGLIADDGKRCVYCEEEKEARDAIRRLANAEGAL